MNPFLAGKTVVITGASSGIGEQVANKVAESGGNVVLLARSTQKLVDLSNRLTDHYAVNANSYSLDVSNMGQVEKTFVRIYEEVGGIDILLNNAGFGIFDFVPDIRLEDLKKMFEVNVLGLIACTKQVVPHMIEKKSGHIINVASIAGKISTPKSTAYSASKHAVLGFTNGLRMELAGTKVLVTSINPGPIQTNFFNIADPKGEYTAKVNRFMLDAGAVAEKIVRVMGQNKREINLPGTMALGVRLYQMFPHLSERIAGRLFKMK